MSSLQDKKYIDFMQEISGGELYEGLLAHGLFTEKLPPMFTSEGFFNYLKTNPFQSLVSKPTQFIYYESMRNLNYPRPFGIPNPFTYHHLCKVFQDNWEKIVSYFERKTQHDNYKVSRVHLRKMKNSPSLFEMNYSNWKTDGSPEVYFSIGSNWVVKADISYCFPSMYSHALGWALVGKDTAKTNRDSNNWFNKIDLCARNIKHGETHGFIIGPHSSNLLSEIILTSVDFKLREKEWIFVRHIDDYSCYVTTYSQAEEFLSDLNKYLREFGLLLNHRKTEILKMPASSKNHWINKIRSIPLTRNIKGRNNKNIEVVDFQHTKMYWETVLEIMSDNKKDSAILNYALKTLAGYNLTDNAKKYCEQVVMHYALIFPYLVPLLDEYLFNPMELSIEDIKQYSEKIFSLNLKNNNFEGICFALYFALKYGFALENVETTSLLETQDCITMLIGFLYFKKTGRDIKPFIEKANDLKSNNEFDQYWIFIYEVLDSTDLKDEWKAIKESGITFLKKGFIC